MVPIMCAILLSVIKVPVAGYLVLVIVKVSSIHISEVGIPVPLIRKIINSIIEAIQMSGNVQSIVINDLNADTSFEMNRFRYLLDVFKEVCAVSISDISAIVPVLRSILLS